MNTEQENQKLILEHSNGEHYVDLKKSTDVKVIKKFEKMGTVVLEPNGAVIVEHGHHFTVKTSEDTPCVIKIVQQEYNPVTKKMMNSID